MKTKFLLIFLLPLFFVISLRTIAQDFEVSPVMMTFKTDPGQTESKTLSVTNHANFQTTFSIDFADFTLDIYGKKIASAKNSTRNSCTEMITPDETHFTLNPNESREIKISMSPPQGDYNARWAMMYVQTVSEQKTFHADKSAARTGLNVRGRIAVQIYRTAKVNIVSKVKINDLEEKIEMKDKLRVFRALLENEGTVISMCKVTFIASNLETAEETEFDPITLNVFPGYPREIEFTLPDVLPSGEYSFVALLDYGDVTTLSGTRMKKKLIIIK